MAFAGCSDEDSLPGINLQLDLDLHFSPGIGWLFGETKHRRCYGLSCVPKNSYEVLTPSTSDCNLGKGVLADVIS